MNIFRTHKLRQLQSSLQIRAQVAQVNIMRAQALANDVTAYNATARSAELAKILQGAMAPQQPAAK
jgi:hypothetical protein